MKTFIQEYAKLMYESNIAVAIYIEQFATKELRRDAIKTMFLQIRHSASAETIREVEKFMKHDQDFIITEVFSEKKTLPKKRFSVTREDARTMYIANLEKYSVGHTFLPKKENLREVRLERLEKLASFVNKANELVKRAYKIKEKIEALGFSFTIEKCSVDTYFDTKIHKEKITISLPKALKSWSWAEDDNTFATFIAMEADLQKEINYRNEIVEITQTFYKEELNSIKYTMCIG